MKKAVRFTANILTNVVLVVLFVPAIPFLVAASVHAHLKQEEFI